MAQTLDIRGTSIPSFQIEKAGVRVKNSSGTRLLVRNAADNANAELEASQVRVSGENIVLNSDAAGSGADWTVTIARPTTGQTAAWTLTLPTSPGTANQVLATDGSGNTSWISAASNADKVAVDTTALVFGSTATVSMFTLPANAVVHKVEVIIDTPFNTAATVSIGITGTTSKYAGSNLIDLQGAAADRYVSTPGVIPVGTSESIIATYSAAAASAGAARMLVYYSVPA